MNTSNYPNPRHIARATIAAVLSAAVISVAGVASHGALPVQASSDRPATPINVTAVDHAPAGSILVSWTNTSSQEVCFEISTYKDGSPVTLGYPSPCQIGPGLGDSLMYEHLDAGSTYCFEVRARQWNNGNPQDGLVSDQWSNPACDTVPVPAPAPKPPTAESATATLLAGSEMMHTLEGTSSSDFIPATSVLNHPAVFGTPTPVPTPIGPVHPR
jgi:hypothetical protein